MHPWGWVDLPLFLIVRGAVLVAAAGVHIVDLDLALDHRLMDKDKDKDRLSRSLKSAETETETAPLDVRAE
jgi:hypothetical protein